MEHSYLPKRQDRSGKRAMHVSTSYDVPYKHLTCEISLRPKQNMQIAQIHVYYLQVSVPMYHMLHWNVHRISQNMTPKWSQEIVLARPLPYWAQSGSTISLWNWQCSQEDREDVAYALNSWGKCSLSKAVHMWWDHHVPGTDPAPARERLPCGW